MDEKTATTSQTMIESFVAAAAGNRILVDEKMQTLPAKVPSDDDDDDDDDSTAAAAGMAIGRRT